jgi:hypothetical protein
VLVTDQTHKADAVILKAWAGGAQMPLADAVVRRTIGGSGTAAAIIKRTQPSSSYSTVVASDSPAGYWRLGETSGYPQDASGNAHHATGGSATQQVAGLINDIDAANSFNGTSDYWMVPDHAGLDLGDVFTLEAWVQRGAIGAARSIVSKATNAYSLELDTDGTLMLRQSNVGTILQTTSDIGTGTHHVVATKNGSDVHLYVDGVEATTGTLNNLTCTDNSSPLVIGGDWDIGRNNNGTIDEVAVYPTALSSARIAAHYAAGTGSPGALTAGAVIAVHVETPATADAVVFRTWSGGSAMPFADAVINRSMPGTASADAIVSRSSGEKTSTADAVILRSSGEKTRTADAVIKRAQSGSLAADAIRLRTMVFGAGGGGGTLGQDDFSTNYDPLQGNPADAGGSWSKWITNNQIRTYASGGGALTARSAVGSTDDYLRLGTGVDGDADLLLTAKIATWETEFEVFEDLVIGSVFARGTLVGGTTLYKATVDRGTLTVSRMTAGSFTTLSSYVTGLGNTDGTRLRLSVSGSSPTSLKARAWTGTEPGTWHVNTSDNTAANQMAGGAFGMIGSAAKLASSWGAGGTRVDDFLVSAAGSPVDGPGPTLDAIIRKERTGSLTADAVAKRTQAASLTADSVVQRTQLSSLTADAYVAHWFTAGAWIAAESQHLHADAVVRREQSGSLSADAVSLVPRANAFFASAIVIASQTSGRPADAVIRRTQAGSATADAIRKRTMVFGSGGLLAQDSFTDTENTLLSAHTPEIGGSWSRVSTWGSGQHPLIASNKASSTSGRSSGLYSLSALADLGDGYIQFTPSWSGDPIAEPTTSLFCRKGGDSTYYKLITYNYDWHEVRRVTNSAETVLGSHASGMGVPFRLTATGVSPTALTVVRDGTQTITANDSTNAFASGPAGIHLNGTEVVVDNDGDLIYYYGTSFADDFSAGLSGGGVDGPGPTLDAIIRRTQSGSLTANAVVRRAQAGSLTADSIVKRGQTGGSTGDAVVRRTETGSNTAYAVVHRASQASLTTDAIIARGQTGSLAADAEIMAPTAGAIAANAIVNAARESSFSASAWIGGTGVSGFAADAVVRRQASATVAADAVAQRTASASLAASAIVRGTSTRVLSADAYILVPGTERTALADAIIRRPFAGAFSTAAWKRSTPQYGISTDAVLRADRSGTFTANAALIRVVASPVTADAVIGKTAQGTLAASSVLLAPRTVGVTADAVTLSPRSGSVAADAFFQRITEASLAAGAVIFRASSTSGFSADAVLTIARPKRIKARITSSGIAATVSASTIAATLVPVPGISATLTAATITATVAARGSNAALDVVFPSFSAAAVIV